jgi:hypothetical protein
VLARESHAPMRGSHALARASHAPLCPPQANARSSPANLLLPCPQPWLSGLFYCSFYFLCIVNFLYFYLLFVGFYLPAMMWFDFEEEIVVGGRPSASLWFFVVPALQPSFYSIGCFTHIGLFTEFLCILHLVRPWNRPGLFMILFESLVITIACYLVILDQIQHLFLYLHYLLLFGFCCWGALPFCFGFILGEPTLCLFLGSLTFSSVCIKSGKDHSL